jgi:hypothetical protein
MDRTTFYGAFNYVIDKCYEENPFISIAFVIPPNLYTTRGSEVLAMTNVRSALFALADKYAAPICDLMKISNYNPSNMNIRTIDGTHPTEAERPRIANILYTFIKVFHRGKSESPIISFLTIRYSFDQLQN